jgi:uncharacterized protein YjbI with pentapeptide repeats
MANRTHVARLKQGVEAWNQWRRDNPKIRPNLSRADLIRASLRGADLRRTNLGKADLSHADLRGAQMSGADLQGAALRGAELIRADLRRADLRGADLFGANLRGADVSYANLSRADLDYANLRGTGLSKSGLTQSPGLLSGVTRPEVIERQKVDASGVASCECARHYPNERRSLPNKLGREAAASMGQCPPKRGGGDAGVAVVEVPRDGCSRLKASLGSARREIARQLRGVDDGNGRGQGGPKQFGPRNRYEPVRCHELSADLTAVELATTRRSDR